MIEIAITKEKSMQVSSIALSLQKRIKKKKNVRPNLKSTEDLFKMLNGKVKIYESYKGMTSKKKSEDEIKEMEKQFEIDLKNAFEIGAELSKKQKK